MMQSPLSEFRLVQLDGTAGAQTIATASINIAAMDCNVADAVLPLLHHATSTTPPSATHHRAQTMQQSCAHSRHLL